MEEDRQFLSVVVPTHNRKDYLRKCLEALGDQSYPGDRYEIIVVDDGSTDGTKETLAEASKSITNLRYFSQPQGGPAKARNLGIEKAKGPIVLFTGDDCIADSRLLEEHNKSHRKNRNVAVLGHVDWHPDLEVTPFMDYIGRTFQFCYPRIEEESSCVSFCFFYTSNISVHKDIFSRTGLFDEDFKDAAFEDTEMGYRIWRAGFRIVYNRRALTYHYHPTTMRGFLERQIRCGMAAATLYSMHPELEDVIHIDDLTRPETRDEYYANALRYYYAVGLQKGLGIIDKELIEKENLPVGIDDLLKRWCSKSSDRLLRMLKDERRHLKKLQEALNGEIEERERRLREQDEIIRSLRGRSNWLEKELESYREFADKVIASLPYRFYKSLKTLLGRTRG